MSAIGSSQPNALSFSIAMICVGSAITTTLRRQVWRQISRNWCRFDLCVQAEELKQQAVEAEERQQRTKLQQTEELSHRLKRKRIREINDAQLDTDAQPQPQPQPQPQIENGWFTNYPSLIWSWLAIDQPDASSWIPCTHDADTRMVHQVLVMPSIIIDH